MKTIYLQLDTSRISRLLDHLSDDECNDHPIINKLNEYDDFNANNDNDNDVCLFPISNSNKDLDPTNPVQISSEEDIVLDVEDLLQLAIDERKGKQEAKQV